MSGSKSKKFAAIGNNITNKKDVISKTSVILQNLVEGDRPDYQYIKIDNIQYNENNDYAESDTAQQIADLANDIKINGLLHNIVVSYTNKGEYKLLSGERRLRAYHHLRDTTHDNKYNEIYALVRKGLSPIDEVIILDAANLMSRGGIENEKKFRKATVRFVDNLKIKFGVTDELAASLTKQYVNVTEAVIEKNIVIERELNQNILALFDDGLISKIQAFEYAKLPNKLQTAIAENLKDVQAKSIADFKELNQKTFNSVQERKKIENELTFHESKKNEIEAEITSLDAKIEHISDETSRQYVELMNEKESLEEQKTKFTEVIDAKEAAIKETEHTIISAVNNVAASESLSTDIFINIEKGLKKIENSIASFDKKATVDKILSLDDDAYQTVRHKLHICINQLGRILDGTAK